MWFASFKSPSQISLEHQIACFLATAISADDNITHELLALLELKHGVLLGVLWHLAVLVAVGVGEAIEESE